MKSKQRNGYRESSKLITGEVQGEGLRNKKIIMYVGIVLLILIVIGIGYMAYNNMKEKDEVELLTEYTPEEEITDDQLRKTIVTLYFMDIATGKVVPEPRQVDVKELIDNPYYFLVTLLIGGPKNETMTKIIPPAAVLNEAKVAGNVVHLDFSEGLIKDQNLGVEQESLIIKSIVSTLTELIEVNAVVITIDGKENMEFPDGAVTFNDPFTRQS